MQPASNFFENIIQLRLNLETKTQYYTFFWEESASPMWKVSGMGGRERGISVRTAKTVWLNG